MIDKVTPIISVDFSENELNSLHLTTKIIASFSIFGLLLVEFCFWYFRKIRTFAFELVMWLSLSSIFFNISFYFNPSDKIENFNKKTLSTGCIIQALLNIFFDLSTMIWTTIIGFTAYISVAHQVHLDKNKMKYRIIFICLGYIPPLIFSLIVFLTNSIGPSGTICWIATLSNVTKTNTLTIIYYCWTWLIILLNCLFVVYLIRLLKNELQNEHELIYKYTSKLRLYPIVQIISFIPATINRFHNLGSNDQNFTLTLLQCIFDSLTGLMFAFVYGFTNTVRNSIGECFQNIFCKKKIQQALSMSESEIDLSRESFHRNHNDSIISDN